MEQVVEIPPRSRERLIKHVDTFRTRFRERVVNRLATQLYDYEQPAEIISTLESIDLLIRFLDVSSRPERGQSLELTASSNLLPLLKRVIIEERRELAAMVESRQKMTVDMPLAKSLAEPLRLLDELMSLELFIKAPAARIPRLTDFLTIRSAEAALGGQQHPPPRQYDEKFGILQAMQLFPQDLNFYRGQCDLRDRPLSVAFIDIDRFKDFNSKYGETRVDRNILSRFMRLLEAAVFFHGQAYRFGGDEYLILLPNTHRKDAEGRLKELRMQIKEERYADVEERITVSTGFVMVDGDCSLTDLEIQEKANAAKNFAKEKGRDRIATYEGPFRPQDLRVVAGEVVVEK